MSKERPILFSGPMVRALLAGTKTQTRRVLNPQPEVSPSGWHSLPGYGASNEACFRDGTAIFMSKFGKPGDRLWVREAWSTHACFDHLPPRECPNSIHYAADGPIQTGKGRPSIHMPRWASRILLEIIDVRVERVQEISDADLECEGLQEIIDSGVDHDGSPRDAWRSLWSRINGAESWDANPWVWVAEFSVAAQAKEQ